MLALWIAAPASAGRAMTGWYSPHSPSLGQHGLWCGVLDSRFHGNDKGCCPFCLTRQPRTIHVGLLTVLDHLPQNFEPDPAPTVPRRRRVSVTFLCCTRSAE